MAVGLVAVLAVTVAVVVAVRSGNRTAADPGVPHDVASPGGSTLPDGFTVPEGAQLIGTPLEYETVDDGASSWTAILSVTGDPIETWSAMLAELFSVLRVPNDASDALGCATYDVFFECVITRVRNEPAPATSLQVTLEMGPVPGDVTGQYSLIASAQRTDTPTDLGSRPWSGGPAPSPPPARVRPGVGDPLAPETVAYDGDNERYVLLAGTELLVQFSPGSVTGGFGVLLRVSPGADVQEIAAAYAEQARQFDAPTRRRVTTNENSTVYGYVPSGGAGGYQGEVYGLDSDSGDDYIYYTLFND